MVQPAPENASPLKPASSRSEKFFKNVLWNWLAVGVSLVIGFVLSPYIVRTLGAERYGIWALVFSVVEYFLLLDLGFLSAIVNFSARFRARGDFDKINEVINTGLFYFLCISSLLVAGTVILSREGYRLFQISPVYHRDFSLLLLLAGLSLSFGIVFNVFTGCLEGFQRFDLSNRVRITTMVLRAGGCITLLAMGYGLVEMAGVVFISQVLGYSLYYLTFRSAFGSLRFSLALVKLPMLKDLAGYAGHSFLANASNLLLNQSAPVLIGHFRPSAYVGYYSLPVRMLQHVATGVARVGFVTAPNVAELSVKNREESVVRLGIYSNRYCFAMFMPLTIFLLIYGHELLSVWINADFALYSAPLLPMLTTATAFAMGGQFNSGAVLFGLGKHKGYARGLVVEAVANVAGMFIVIPRYGLVGAAWLASLLMALVRGLFTPWLVCRHLRCRYRDYMSSIYLRPILVALPVAGVLYLCRSRWISGQNWFEILTAAALVSVLYFGAAFFTCVEPKHRALLLSWISRRLKSNA